MSLHERAGSDRPKVLAIVLAGGEGTRLRPLTAKRSKPAVPFGLTNRVVDFVIANLVNSGVTQIYVVAQYKPHSLIEHVRAAWPDVTGGAEGFVRVVLPNPEFGRGGYSGTADAIVQNLDLLEAHDPDLVAVFSADHVYRMNVADMIRSHLHTGADVTISALSVPIERGSGFGILNTDSSERIHGFQEKPRDPAPLPFDAGRTYASMGNYLFTAEALKRIARTARVRGDRDFGHDVLGWVISGYRAVAYDFAANLIPGLRPYELSPYWHDIGTIGAYWEAHQDILGAAPGLDMANPHWPIGGADRDGAEAVRAVHEDSLISRDASCAGAVVKRSVIRGNVLLEDGVVIEDSILLGDAVVKSGAHLKRVVMDRYNVIESGMRIGFDKETDARRWHRDRSGIVVIPHGKVDIAIDDQRELLRA